MATHDLEGAESRRIRTVRAGSAASHESTRMHIGEVAQRVGLSLRTIRHYEDVGLIAASTRSPGGFRLYTEQDVARLQLVVDMKPLGFTLGEMRQLLEALDAVADEDATASQQEVVLERLSMYGAAAEARCRALRAELRHAESFSGKLRRSIAEYRERIT